MEKLNENDGFQFLLLLNTFSLEFSNPLSLSSSDGGFLVLFVAAFFGAEKYENKNEYQRVDYKFRKQ